MTTTAISPPQGGVQLEEADVVGVQKQPTLERIPTRPSLVQVVNAIREEVRIPDMAIREEDEFPSIEDAEQFIRWMDAKVRDARAHGYGKHFMTQGELDRYHYILLTIAPDDVMSTPGSAHALLEGLLLNPRRDETNIVHSGEDVSGTADYCTVEVAVGGFF